MSFVSELFEKNIVLLGAGTTGAGAVSFLRENSKSIQVIDEKVAEALGQKTLRQLPDESIDLAIVSPGWRKDHPLISELRNRDVEVISELDFAWLVKEEICPEQKWVAVTGTNGKTTTVQMLETILKQAGLNAIAAGNVGLPALAAVTDPNKFEVLALELSSFQIDWSELPIFEASAILNIAEDHIDWHGSFSDYANSKMKILENSNCAVLNLSDPEIVLRATAWQGRKIFFSLGTPQAGEIGLVEELLIDRAFVHSAQEAELFAEISDVKPSVPHNILNAMAAGAVALSLGIPHPVVKQGLANFELDRHRLELVKNSNGISWINDSKATNPHAAIAALSSSLSNIWIAGGLAKGAKMDSLIQKSVGRIKAVILIGTDRDLISDSLNKFAPKIPKYFIDMTGSSQDLMDEVVSKAIEVAEKGDTVLLAPACASMDQFKSYAERGENFSNSVNRLVK